MLVVMVGFVVFVLVWLIGFVRHFSRVEGAEKASS